MFSRTLIALAFSASALANVFITFPVASTTLTGGQQANITWQDDGKSPSLQQFGPAKISIYVGNAQQQTSLQLAGQVDVSTASSLSFTPDPTIGPNGNEYFIRVESISLKDATNPQYPALAFSAKFTMAGMTGTFTPAEQSQIDGQSTAPIGTTTVPAPTASTTASLTTSKAASTASASVSKSAASATSTAKSTSGAAGLAVSGFAAVAGAVFVAAVL
jgi:hypothetical protein